LRQAHITALKSPELITDAKRQGITIASMSGEEVERTAKNLYKTPSAIIEQYKKFTGLK
jgi:tripartite-type tricarboxylate transporter receptor subunit TctC